MDEFDRRKRRSLWIRARAAEAQYSLRLKGIAGAINAIVRGFAPDGTPEAIAPLLRALHGYSELIGPWAESVAGYMLADVNRRNERAWAEHGDAMGRSLRQMIRTTPVGAEYRSLLRAQVGLIKSLPTRAAERVHSQVQEGMLRGTRSTDIAKSILTAGRVTEARAKLIARTEVSRAAVTLTQARAQALGSEGEIWRTVGDPDVRPSHQKVAGKYVRWDSPPKTDASLDPYHAGCGPNCRCYPDPVLPEY